MKRITRWTTDTCGCTLEYESDNTDINKEPTFHSAVHVCKDHLNIPDKKRVYDAVRRENVNKNLTYKILIEETDFGEDATIVEEDERQVRRLKPDLEFNYKFTGSDPEHRILEFSIRDSKTKQKLGIPKADMDKIDNALKNKVDKKLRAIADVSRIKTV